MVVKELLPKLEAAVKEAAEDVGAASMQVWGYLDAKKAATEKKNKAEALVKSTEELHAFLSENIIPVRAALTFANWRFYCYAGTLVAAVLKRQQPPPPQQQPASSIAHVQRPTGKSCLLEHTHPARSTCSGVALTCCRCHCVSRG